MLVTEAHKVRRIGDVRTGDSLHLFNHFLTENEDALEVWDYRAGLRTPSRSCAGESDTCRHSMLGSRGPLLDREGGSRRKPALARARISGGPARR
jgi:hypothetical protein